MNPAYPLTARRIALILDAISAKPMHVHDISDRIALCLNRTQDYLKMMLKDGLIHIPKWVYIESSRVYAVALYKHGPGRNAPKPAKKTASERNARWYKKRQNDDDRNEMYLARRNAARRADRAAKVPTTWLSALGV